MFVETNELVVYSLSSAPISYIGEIVSNDADNLVLKRVLVLFQHHGKGESETISIGNVPYASRDSTVSICKRVSPGVLINNIDDDLKEHYRKEIISAYSKLRIIA
jgi:hypothetical protein